jgi:hypothetical protein
MGYEFTVNCCFCSEKHEIEIELPEGWLSRYNGTDDENGFCPKHAAIADFAEKQCPGCVGGWQDCSLWSAFAYSKFSLTEHDLETIEGGICPKRTNGTFMTDTSKPGAGFESVHLDELAPTESGVALAQALREYRERWHPNG